MAAIHENQKRTPNKYFTVDIKQFEKYLRELAGVFIIDNSHEMIATLWGSVYLYEFLYANKIIAEAVYNQFIEISRHTKAMVLARFTSSLWMTDFIHQWVKPNSVTEDVLMLNKRYLEKLFMLIIYQ